MTLLVKWNRERFHLAMPPPGTKLGALRKYVSEQTHLQPDNFKMILSGGIMKDDNAPLSAYGIEDGRTIHIIGSADIPAARTPARPFSKPAAPATENNVIAAIHNELSGINSSIRPLFKRFINGLSEPADSEARQPWEALEVDHKRIGELLLQSLLRLDALSPDGEWIDARSERKKAVKEIQTMLDELDGSWKEAQATR